MQSFSVPLQLPILLCLLIISTHPFYLHLSTTHVMDSFSKFELPLFIYCTSTSTLGLVLSITMSPVLACNVISIRGKFRVPRHLSCSDYQNNIASSWPETTNNIRIIHTWQNTQRNCLETLYTP